MHHLAIDIGATGGKVYLGRVDDATLEISEVYRFDNRPVERDDGRYIWNVSGLLEGVITGIREGDRLSGGLDSIGVDTMGVDFGLLANGELLQEPYSYRDPTVSSSLDELLEIVDQRTIFEASGISHWNAKNSLWQYHYLANYEPELLEAADTMVMMPQVVSTLLGGRPCAEVTVASTTQMVDPTTYSWATGLLEELGLPIELLPDIEVPGTSIGTLDSDVLPDLSTRPDLVLPASHDTASAVAAMPFSGSDRAFLATGTVFILGVELDDPNRSAAAFEIGASNEVGVEGTIRFLKNLNNGFFLLEECREVWKREDDSIHEYEPLLLGAEGAEPFLSLIDPEATIFDTVGNMPTKIRTFCERTGQPVPADESAITRCILESLAVKVSLKFDEILEATGASSDVLHLGGGGARNVLFCEMLAAATDRNVVAGPSDAAAVGNVLTQAQSYSRIDSIADGRRLVGESLDFDTYEPTTDGRWEDAAKRMRALEKTDVRRIT